jgi:phosphatidylserine/phosphatidylglycerophosphate/cardiolipin synthase-like enzyme
MLTLVYSFVNITVPGGLNANSKTVYGNGWSCVDVASEIIKTIRKKHPDANDELLRMKIEQKLRICFIRQKRGQRYTDGMPIGMHAKHFIIDGICSYIGSQNLYICDLAEWGVFVDDQATTEQMMSEFWNPMWSISFTGEDCDVQAVMDGLAIDREGKDMTYEQRREWKHLAKHQGNASPKADKSTSDEPEE